MTDPWIAPFYVEEDRSWVRDAEGRYVALCLRNGAADRLVVRLNATPQPVPGDAREWMRAAAGEIVSCEREMRQDASDIAAILARHQPLTGDVFNTQMLEKIEQLCEIAHQVFHVLEDCDQDAIRAASLHIGDMEKALNAFIGGEGDVHYPLDELRVALKGEKA